MGQGIVIQLLPPAETQRAANPGVKSTTMKDTKGNPEHLPLAETRRAPRLRVPPRNGLKAQAENLGEGLLSTARRCETSSRKRLEASSGATSGTGPDANATEGGRYADDLRYVRISSENARKSPVLV